MKGQWEKARYFSDIPNLLNSSVYLIVKPVNSKGKFWFKYKKVNQDEYVRYLRDKKMLAHLSDINGIPISNIVVERPKRW